MFHSLRVGSCGEPVNDGMDFITWVYSCEIVCMRGEAAGYRAVAKLVRVMLRRGWHRVRGDKAANRFRVQGDIWRERLTL